MNKSISSLKSSQDYKTRYSNKRILPQLLGHSSDPGKLPTRAFYRHLQIVFSAVLGPGLTDAKMRVNILTRGSEIAQSTEFHSFPVQSNLRNFPDATCRTHQGVELILWQENCFEWKKTFEFHLLNVFPLNKWILNVLFLFSAALQLQSLPTVQTSRKRDELAACLHWQVADKCFL